jgi:hypothetical protein
MNETTIRNLTPRELAESLRYSDDQATRRLAPHIIEHEIGERNFEEEVEGIEEDRDSAISDKEQTEREIEDLKELLRECAELVPDADLIARIKASV